MTSKCMKRPQLLLAMAVCLLFCGTSDIPAAQPDDAGQSSPLTSADSVMLCKLDGYLSEVDKLALPLACEECNFIIASVPDSTLRNRVAEHVYRHFRQSKYMGAENVAIYVYDRWFAPFRTVFADMNELDEAEFFAFVNRSSLIGTKAPVLKFPTSGRDSVTVPSPVKKKGSARKSIIYFYSSDCPKCLYTSVCLTKFLNSSKYKVNLFAVYTLEDRERWKKYIHKELDVRTTCRTRVYHLYGGDVDYVVPYGVIQTPRLFLVDENGIVIGRNLDVPALKILLEKE